MGKRGRGQSSKRRPATKQSEMIREKKEDKKRQRLDTGGGEGSFEPGPNDILVDDQRTKVMVKVEAEGGQDSGVTVKQEGADSRETDMEDAVTESVNDCGGLPEDDKEVEDRVPVVEDRVVNQELIIANGDQEGIMESVASDLNQPSREDELVEQRNEENRAMRETVIVVGLETQLSNDARVVSNCVDAEVGKVLQEEDLAIANLKKCFEDQAESYRLGELENKEDYLKCCEGSIKIDGVLEEEKVLRLFDEVLKVLIQQEMLSPEGLEDGYIDWDKHCSLLLSCRLICKSWKSCVDNLLENDPSHLSIVNDVLQIYDFGAYRPFHATFNFRRNKEWIQAFTADFKKQQELCPEYNPIPTRHLKLSMNSPIAPKQLRLVSNFLQAFGAQVWHLTVNLYPTDFEDFIRTVKHLSQWLELLPNLKSVALEGSGQFEQELREQLRTNPDAFQFPHLKNLAIFQFDNYSPVMWKMLQNNNQIEKLNLVAFRGYSHMSRILELELTNLSELTIGICRKEHLDKLGTVTWNLRSLNLSLEGCFDKEGFAIKNVFNVLRKFGNLESLSLGLSYCDMNGMLDEPVLTLPRLNFLRLGYYKKNVETVQWRNLLKKLRGAEGRLVLCSVKQGCHLYYTVEDVDWDSS